MKQKFVLCKNGNVFIRTGVYEDILKKYNPEWIDLWYEGKKE